ncbi:MAG: class I SAM-dependent methyltransferase [Mojavia pulchra JT2-VF2]|jgi:SAM-dependent methyltransferase|uniref:Class I SAM-dependent methyltransferase n=1 Tax=Mojavia pulchra JT2-VF2 TaxID=287848 RepID=A0A951Q271_9NOST|nr:class I SAM-dependent methyltransferase [Mojavia pulchra JT2-VF2]
MIQNLSKSLQDNEKISKQRIKCVVCNSSINENKKSALATFASNVRAFRKEKFKVWRCSQCQTIHCLDVVDLPQYYAKYPIAQAKLTWPYLFYYRNLRRQLTKHGFSKNHSFLDYGCANGLFLEYLQKCGFANCYGYDPYGSENGFGDRSILNHGPFDYILLQDVIEHVEDPHELLSKLDSLLAPGGYILIGTPNAANLDLSKPHISDFYNDVHVPYHLHIYTRESLESVGYKQGWQPVEFFARPYHDTPWFAMNTRAWNQYQRLFDGSIDTIYEPLKVWKALASYKFWFYALFGYWLSFRTGMAVMFRKSR